MQDSLICSANELVHIGRAVGLLTRQVGRNATPSFFTVVGYLHFILHKRFALEFHCHRSYKHWITLHAQGEGT